MPAVSISRTGRGSPFGSCHSQSTAIESRVIPASGPVIIRSSPSMRLMSVDLPAFGRPTMASFSGASGRSSSSASGISAIARSRCGSSASNRSPMPSPCSADSCTGSPNPSASDSRMPCSPARPSALLAARITGVDDERSQRAISSSSGTIPARASNRNSATSAWPIAASVCMRIRPGSVCAS